MTTFDELLSRSRAFALGLEDEDEFEDWFTVESWNTHQLGDARLDRLVGAVESCFQTEQQVQYEGFKEPAVAMRELLDREYPMEKQHGEK